ncbi:hypothetical protein [Fodinicola feengrottensis]|uniref:hypothetical protein n=1 Tax=Fodinicola feengrottensis TaxID=435914 RepID=UPI0013D13407|nr:hypothetical protein [Fodinicola feengrottensis]
MARQEFGKLVANDGTYFAVTLLALAVGWLLGVPWSLTELLGAMTVGAVAAILLAVIQLPRAELSALRPGFAGLRTVAAFAAWRSGQATMRPATLLVARLMVQIFGSLAAVGAMEAARLLLAPAQTVISGAGSFLLSTFVSAEKSGERGRTQKKLANRAVWALVVAVVIMVGVVAAALRGPLGWLVTGGKYELSAIAVVGWAVYLATWAATLPYVTEIVARQRSRDVFVVRLVDSVLGVVATLVVLAAGLGYPWVPWGMSVGGLVAAVWLRQIAVRTRPDARIGGRHRMSRRRTGVAA